MGGYLQLSGSYEMTKEVDSIGKEVTFLQFEGDYCLLKQS